LTEASLGISGGSQDGFASQLALSGDTLLATAPRYFDGAVVVATRSGSTWSSSQFLTPSGGGGKAYAGAVAISGSSAVVSGLPDGSSVTNWLFTRTGPSWFPQGAGIMPASAIDAGVVLPRSLAMDGSNYVTGSWYGASVYATTGGQPVNLLPSDFTPAPGVGVFGGQVAISGSTALVSGGLYDAQAQLAHWGYVFVKSGASWTQQARLVPSDLASNSGPAFRFNVAINGDTAVLASTFGAYVFARSGTTWSQIQKIAPVTANAPFGTAVALSGNLLVIGGGSETGAAGQVYVFARSKNTWVLGPTLSTGVSADGFGLSLALSQGTLVVGAPSKSPTTGTSTGAAYVYACSP
jgi:hypothetical protein